MPASNGAWGDDLAAAAVGHAQELAALAGPDSALQVPVFDVLMLGVGPDAHIASLFPDHSDTHVDDVSVYWIDDSPKPPPQRLTFTFPVIRSATEVWLVASGAEKAAAFAEALKPGADISHYPAAGAKGRVRTLALVDEAAASELPESMIRRS